MPDSNKIITGTPYLIQQAAAYARKGIKYGVPVIIFGLIFCQAAAPAVAPGHDSELIVKYRNQESRSSVRAPGADGAYTVKSMQSDSRLKLVRAGSPAQAMELKKNLAADPNVQYVEMNQRAQALFAPNDPFYNDGAQWNLKAIQAPAAWDLEPGAGNGVIVAVADTGVAYENHFDSMYTYGRAPDLSPATFVPGWDFVNNDSHPNDDHGHGTHVAGIIAAATNNGLGVASLAYGARIMPIKVLDESGAGYSSDIADGIHWAAKHGAKVINLSLGLKYPSRVIEDAISYARNVQGATVVAAAGNSADPKEYPNYNGGLMYPARYSTVISVGATRYGGKRAAYSQYGPGLDLVAPGGEMLPGLDPNKSGVLEQTILQAVPFDPSKFGYYWADGTSIAAPHVAAAAAMVIAGGITQPAGVYKALTRTAKDLGPTGFDNKYGYGLLNVPAALRWRP